MSDPVYYFKIVKNDTFLTIYVNLATKGRLICTN